MHLLVVLVQQLNKLYLSDSHLTFVYSRTLLVLLHSETVTIQARNLFHSTVGPGSSHIVLVVKFTIEQKN